MTTFEKHYIKYFTPLIQDFVRDVEALPHPEIKKIPEPFFPLFGKNYESSALKLVVVGQDTYWWGDIREFIAAEKANPGSKLVEKLNLFRTHKFTAWGGPRQSFWGFAMMFLAALHGQDDWEAMKQDKMVEILDSFAWGNGNAVELYGSTASNIGVPAAYWDSIRRAGERLNRFRHIQETLRPHVVVVMYRGINISTYFEGYHPEIVSKDGRLTHYRLPEVGVDVFHVPHPKSMNFNEGPDYFRDKLKELFVQHGLTAVFNKFLSGQEGKKAMEYLHAKARAITPDFDKYKFVAWVADELAKRDAFMSVPALMDLVNAKGGETNYGTPFSGGRGSYRLVSGTYWRLMNGVPANPSGARNVAVAFRRPNFEYAYNTD
jgi:hypothetical protein